MAFIVLPICCALLLLIAGGNAADCNNDKVLFCYYSSWAIYRESLGKYNVSNIDPQLCTHMVYAFAGLNLDGYTFALDSFNDLPEAGGAGQYYWFRQMREQNPCLKIMLSIGGWEEGSEKYSVMVESPESRTKFVEHLHRYLVYYGFDGVDIDWEYPGSRGGIAADKAKFVLLLKELKAKLEPRNRQLAVAVAASPGTAEIAYDIKGISETVDYVLLMAYDYHNMDKTSHVAPLKSGSTTPNGAVDVSVDYWLNNGCPANKLALGIITSGRSYTLASASSNDLGAAVKGPGVAGEFTKIPGFLGYYEICDLQYYDPQGWQVVNDTNTNNYMYKGDQWVTYEDPTTAKAKAEYAYSKQLAGAMIWTVDTDDFMPICDGKNAMHVAIREGLKMT